MTTTITTVNTHQFQQKNEDAVKQFIEDSLHIDLPSNKSLQDILKDGIILCDLIKQFAPSESIIKNEGRTKFAYQDNIGQFLRVAECLHIPQSDLFQTVDLLEGKRMQSVISCLLAIKRKMCERKGQPKSHHKTKNISTRNLLLLINDTNTMTTTKKIPAIPKFSQPAKVTTKKISDWPKNVTEKKKYFHTEPTKKTSGGYVKSQVQIISTQTPLEVPTRRLSSECFPKKESPRPKQRDMKLPPTPKPSKSTPLVLAAKSAASTALSAVTATKKSPDYTKSSMVYNKIEANRKSSLKKMGSCAIPVVNDDGTSALYALGRSIGKGQFGEVFGGLNMDTGEYVAIKRIKRNQMDCDDMNEVGLLKHLNSEHIVRYVGFSKDKEYLNIILEYAEMGSLYNNIKAFGKFPEKLAASYTYKILSGLHYLHSKDVIHCDLKAANILTTKTGSLKLTDFGVSLSLKMKDDEDTGEPAGTPNWMAPEVIKFAGASAKSDIWSLGCTIVEMMTGKPPYAGMPSFAALYKIVEDDEPPIPKNMILSDDAQEFLLACFQKNPDDRPSASDLMKYKWMEPYFSQDEQNQSALLSPPEKQLKKSRSDPLIELSDSETLSDGNDYKTHDFEEEVTYQIGEKCQGCHVQIKRTTFKRCQECHLNYHTQCIYKASPCSRGYNIPQNIIKSNSNTDQEFTKKTSRYTPLGPCVGDIKKIYLPVVEQPHYKTEGYSSHAKRNNSRRISTPSSVMT